MLTVLAEVFGFKSDLANKPLLDVEAVAGDKGALRLEGGINCRFGGAPKWRVGAETFLPVVLMSCFSIGICPGPSVHKVREFCFEPRVMKRAHGPAHVNG